MSKLSHKENQLAPAQIESFLNVLSTRFNKNPNRHKGIDWKAVEKKLRAAPEKLWSLSEMERTGGEPDVIADSKDTGVYHFYDCSPESPNGRRSFCYDRKALEERKEHKPKNNVIDCADEMGVELLNEEQYRQLQQFGKFDTKTSSWLKTPDAIRNLDGALFGDYRYGTVFVYHNGVQSYYAARGFRARLVI